jgi:hypothetical protein
MKFFTQRIPHLVTGDVNEGVLRPSRFFRFTQPSFLQIFRPLDSGDIGDTYCCQKQA